MFTKSEISDRWYFTESEFTQRHHQMKVSVHLTKYAEIFF